MLKKNLIPVLAALALALPLAACANDRAENGGGGGTAQQERAQTDGNNAADQLRANMPGTELEGASRKFADAYARLPWIHANLAATDWERALDDLQHVRDQLAELQRDNRLNPEVKAKLAGLKPITDRLDREIQAHDRAALMTTATLLNRFTALTNDPKTLAWISGPARK